MNKTTARHWLPHFSHVLKLAPSTKFKKDLKRVTKQEKNRELIDLEFGQAACTKTHAACPSNIDSLKLQALVLYRIIA